MSTYITIRGPWPSQSGKTSTWEIVAKRNGALLGEIRWFGRWRRYALYPVGTAIFEQNCLREIADFCELSTKRQRILRQIPSKEAE